MRLHLPGVHSLKEKRGIIKGLLARVQQRFAVAVAEVEHQDVWQSAGLGMAAVGNDAALLQSRLRKVVQFIERSGQVVVADFRVDVIT
ncbi:MAG: DUF503 domain-containing protein [Magnetococcales bacterium]|nr:DUF503 domain-containing protein [Magnetococcales bacterium]MBF0322909.1 DUF503 domain-containing protein [Magnetococcales bacterium]